MKVIYYVLCAKVAVILLFLLNKHISVQEPKLEAKVEDEKTVGVGERTGVLDGLLSLPAINPEKSTKDEINRYFTLIEQSKVQVEARIKALRKQDEKLRQLEKKIAEKIEFLERERQFFTSALQKEKDIKKERLKVLINLYLKMEPKKAAPIFAQMDKDLVVSLFKELKEKQVTSILEAMAPAKSVELSEYFARLSSAKEYELLQKMNMSLQEAFADCKPK